MSISRHFLLFFSFPILFADSLKWAEVPRVRFNNDRLLFCKLLKGNVFLYLMLKTIFKIFSLAKMLFSWSLMFDLRHFYPPNISRWCTVCHLRHFSGISITETLSSAQTKYITQIHVFYVGSSHLILLTQPFSTH